MNIKNKGISVRGLDIKSDHRGWLAEILRGDEMPAGGSFGQLFITVANPGAVKGNHFHTRKSEWFCAIQGNALLIIENNESGVRDEIPMGEENMVTVKVPPGHTHAVKNTGTSPLSLLVYISEPFNPDDPDTFAKKIIYTYYD